MKENLPTTDKHEVVIQVCSKGEISIYYLIIAVIIIFSVVNDQKETVTS